MKFCRLGIVGAIALILLNAGCHPRATVQHVAVHSPAVVASHSDTVAVYERALETLYESTSERPGVVVIIDSAVVGSSACYQAPCRLSPSVDSHVSASTLESYGRALRWPGPLPADLHRPIPIVRISERELNSFVQLGAAHPNPVERRGQSPDYVWDEFRRRFPSAWGLTSMSRIGFGNGADQALLQVRHGCGSSCARMESMFFEKRGGTWFLESRFPEQSSDWLGQGELRYVGPDSRARAMYFRRLDSLAMAAADSLRRDVAPRRVRGKVINRAFGTAIPYAQIFVHSRVTEPKPWARVVADSLGHFEVKDPPIGTVMLEVQCPGSEHTPGRTLDSPGFYLFPEMDTTITMGPPDMRPCWSPRRVHRLTAGPIESGENRSSSFPSGADAEVFAAVLRQIVNVRGTSGERAVLSARTYTRCAKLEPCGTLRLPQLTTAGVLDSATINDFRSRSQESVPLSAQFASDRGLDLLTSDERTYLREEGSWLDNFQQPDEERDGFWKALASTHLNANAIISLTRAGFNAAKTQAIVQVRTERSDDRTTNTILLKRVGSAWRVVRHHLEAETLSGKLTPATGKFAAGRCVPSRPGSPPTLKQLSEIRGDYAFEMISSVGGGPAVQWRMRFFPDTSAWARLEPKEQWTKAQREKFESLRKFARPVFIVLNPKTGERWKSVEAGTYVKSGERYFSNADHTGQFDGFGYDFEIHAVTETEMFGSWEHYSFGVRIDSNGNALPEPSGHFCARRIPPIP